MNVSNAETADSYSFAFKFGGAISILMLCFITVTSLFNVLVALALWIPFVLFILPWFYICQKRGLHVPPWALRGPHE